MSMVDTVYMVIFGAILQFFFENQPGFLLAFGFEQKSYFASLGLFVWLFVVSVDIPLRVVMNFIRRHNELNADRYAVRLGFGISLKNALVRSYAENLDILYQSEVDNFLYGSHPTLQARVKSIDDELDKNE